MQMQILDEMNRVEDFLVVGARFPRLPGLLLRVEVDDSALVLRIPFFVSVCVLYLDGVCLVWNFTRLLSFFSTCFFGEFELC